MYDSKRIRYEAIVSGPPPNLPIGWIIDDTVLCNNCDRRYLVQNYKPNSLEKVDMILNEYSSTDARWKCQMCDKIIEFKV